MLWPQSSQEPPMHHLFCSSVCMDTEEPFFFALLHPPY